MQMIVEARLVDDLGETEPVRLGVVERELTTSPVGMSLAEGKAILAAAQRFFVDVQCQGIAAAHAVCEHCDRPLSVKGWHQRQLRTVFGRVTVRSPRVRICACENKRPGASFSPLTLVVPTRVTPELEYLQVKWAAHLPYAAASKLLAEVLPINGTISVSGMKRRVRAVGAALERGSNAVPSAAAAATAADQVATPRPSLTALAVDSAWLRHCDPPRRQGRHVNLVAGRACFEGGSTRVYAYVHNQVASVAGRLDEFLAASGVDRAARVTDSDRRGGGVREGREGMRAADLPDLGLVPHRDEVQGSPTLGVRLQSDRLP